MDFSKFIDWAFLGIIAAFAGWIAKSVADLNVKIAVVISQIESHEKRIDHLEKKN
jgi:hypothetical protein